LVFGCFRGPAEYEAREREGPDFMRIRPRSVITRTAEAVFDALMYLTEKYGRVFPSLEGLAHLAMCCKQSVVTALADLEALGFVTRIRRIRRVATALGFKVEQITNAYRVHEPTRAASACSLSPCSRASTTIRHRAGHLHGRPSATAGRLDTASRQRTGHAAQ
jgi:hypothetical protein